MHCLLPRHYRKPRRGSRVLRRRETRRRLRPTAFDARSSVPGSFKVALYCRTHSDNHAISAGSSVHEISSPLLLTTTQVHSSLTYANAGPSFSHRSISSPWSRVAITECKGELNRWVQRPNFPSASIAKACDMPKTLKELWRDSSGIGNLNV